MAPKGFSPGALLPGRFHRILAFALLLAGLSLPVPALAQSVYVASGVPVDVTGDAATLRDQAVLMAQREALKKILAEIAPADQVAGLVLPGDDVIGSWVADVEIEEEKMAATHYIGRYTVRFQAAPIQEFLGAEGVAFAETRSKQMLLIPVFTDETGNTGLWGPTNQWLSAWSTRPPSNALVPIVVPRGDLDDQNTLSATEALGGNEPKLDFMGERYQAGDVVVAEARMSPAGADGTRSLALDVARYGIDGTERFQETLSGDAADPDGLMAEGVATVQAMLEGAWKSANLVDPNKRAQLSVHVPLAGIEQWVAIKRRLGAVNLIKGVNLKQLAKDGADLEISYAGDEAQFIRALSQADLMLVPSGEGMATLTLGASSTATPTP
ncbi:DUF2066 domain-containing protein [Dongia mobilis]|uniref:DUF2066 domain-containing protein n=1 Tax=Dongia sp. TaxID=1977262 RepID=UPI0026F254DC